MHNIITLFPGAARLGKKTGRPHLLTPTIAGDRVPDRGTPQEELIRACYRMQSECGLAETYATLRRMLIDVETAVLDAQG